MEKRKDEDDEDDYNKLSDEDAQVERASEMDNDTAKEQSI